ncbi:MAG TPA: helix-turn-helix domain-containing protein, partial [Polyangiales bacterium]|nr:helix-turn-helix domain-containing protein [Polyangiales bacterium]
MPQLTPSTLIPNDPSPERQIVGFRSSESLAKTLGWYHHPRGQLVWSPDRVQHVHTATGVWITPPAGAMWVPPDVLHRTHTPHEHNLSLERSLCAAMPDEPCVVRMTPALVRLFRATLDAVEQDDDTGRYVAQWRDGIRDAGLAPLPDPLPRAAEASIIAWAAQLEAAPQLTLAAWSASTRRPLAELSTALFRATGMSFRQWRRRVLLRRAAQLMAEGLSVRDAGGQAGYRSASHFVAA